ncbi:GntP family permease [Tahibacter amnicola]|uniref:SLC13 family permease n=1 Tax=Tahibacter amnicola TaxID=2976241 RepID=A0ABY6BI44_9GAMM|nr:SLC13 family permease [Tahibacter amnicola]UXI69452.1 SLC13 family permease [Tahibacter amnicola]
MLSLVGLGCGLALLIVLAMRGVNLFIATPLCAAIVALTSGLPLLPVEGQSATDLVSTYMQGFAGFVSSWFFMFLLGSIFGKLMEDTGAAESVARWVVDRIGVRHAAFAVVAACVVLTYGGVSLFVVAFSVYPTALSLFRAADLPRRFIPAALGFGSITITMTAAGSPEIQNWIPIKFLHTSPWAGWQASLVAAIVMAALGQWWLNSMIRRAKARGERFETRENDPVSSRSHLPSPLLSLVPLLVVLALSFLLHERYHTGALIIALFAGCVATAALGWRYLAQPGHALAEGSTGALIAIGNTAAVVGFGAVAKAAPAFAETVTWITHLPGGGIVNAAIAVSLIAAMTGSASGGQAIALPILAPLYLAQGVDPGQLHRSVALASGALDAMPHNGYIVTTIRAICGDTHQAAYWPMAAMTMAVPTLGLIVALACFALGLD